MISDLLPVHPGEILREGFLAPLGLSPATLARALAVPPVQIERLAWEQASVTTGMAVLLAKYFGTTVQFWMGLQAQHDLEYARELVAAAPRRGEPAHWLTA
jgi:addiction module HigA family antidote